MRLPRLELKCGWPTGTRGRRRIASLALHAFLLAALATAAPACDETTTPTGPSATNVTVRGQVLDYGDGSPLANVTVRFASDGPGFQAQATTDAIGMYVATLPTAFPLVVRIDDLFVGMLRAATRLPRGDLFIDRTTCVARYGVILDGRTLRPIAGAAVSLTGRSVMTGADGWYRIDLGCPEVTFPGGTTVISVSASGYVPRQQVVGRGVQGVSRLDLGLEKS